MAVKKKILIVEDDPLLAEALKIRLDDENDCEVIGVASSGGSAIELAKQHLPDVILCDIQLDGEMSGIEVANQIKASNDVPIIFASSNVNEEAIKSNPYGYLIKPIDYDEVKIAIELAFYRSNLEKKLTSYHAHLAQAQQLGNMGSWEWDILTDEITWTDQIFRIFGLEPQLFSPTYPLFLERIHPDDRQAVVDAVTGAVHKHQPYDIEHRVIRSDGNIHFVHEIGEVKYDNNNNPLSMIGTILDISERKAAEDKIAHMAYHDPLTDLPNRALLLDRLYIQLATAKRNKQKFSVLFIDLDGFKAANDTYGHKIGDTILQQVAQRIQKATRHMDTVARIGGDEFIALIQEMGSGESARAVAQKILLEINKPYTFHAGIKVNISASIGIAVYPDDGQTADELLTNSDDAMYIAKHEGKNQVHLFAEKTA